MLFTNEKFNINGLKKHLSNSEFSFMRGAFLSIDRPYGKIINILHHHIGSSHVVHHVCPTIPHYYAKKATIEIKGIIVAIEKDSNNPSGTLNPSPLSSMNGIAPKEPRAT